MTHNSRYTYNQFLFFMEAKSDQAWIRELKQENKETIESLWKMIYKFAVQTARQRQAPNDMAHDAAIAAYNRIRQRGVNQYQFACPFPGYCRVIVVREFLRLYRDLTPEHTPIDETNEELLGEGQSNPLIEKKEVLERIQPCIEKLPNNLKRVVELIYFQNHDPEQVANKMSIQRNYVNQLAHRARQKLRQCLESLGYLTVGDVFSL